MQIGRLLMVVCVFFGIPLNLFPGRKGLILIYYGEERRLSNLYHHILTLTFFALATLLSIVYPEIIKVISILGGYFGCSFGILVPSSLFI